MRKKLGMLSLAVLLVIAVLVAGPPPAQAFSPEKWGLKFLGTIVDTVGIVVECPKTIGQEVPRWQERYIVGVPFATAAGCVASTGKRVGSVVVDWVTNVIPVTTKHAVEPRSWQSMDPLVEIPK